MWQVVLLFKITDPSSKEIACAAASLVDLTVDLSWPMEGEKK